MLFAVCRLLCFDVVCCSLFAVCCVVLVVCRLLFVVCCMLCVVCCCSLFVIMCCLLFVVWCFLLWFVAVVVVGGLSCFVMHALLFNTSHIGPCGAPRAVIYKSMHTLGFRASYYDGVGEPRRRVSQRRGHRVIIDEAHRGTPRTASTAKTLRNVTERTTCSSYSTTKRHRRSGHG